MAVSIGSLKYDIIADTAQFQNGIVATRRELTAAKNVFRDTRTPAENLGIEIEGLSRLLKKGAIDQETYNRAVADLKKRAAIAEGGIKGLTAQFKNLSGTMKTAVKGFLAFQATRGILAGVRSELDRIDEAAKTSRKLGLVTDELIALQLAGMADGSVDMAVQRMTRRLAEAAAGTGEAKKAIEELGLSAQDLNLMGPFDAFAALSDAIAGVDNDADQLRLAFKLFDSEGAALVNVLKEGGQAVDEFRTKARDLGMTFTDDVARNVEEANDALPDDHRSHRGTRPGNQAGGGWVCEYGDSRGAWVYVHCLWPVGSGWQVTARDGCGVRTAAKGSASQSGPVAVSGGCRRPTQRRFSKATRR